MNPVARARIPWLVAAILLVLVLIQVQRLTSVPTRNSTSLLIPIRLPSTHPDPDEKWSDENKSKGSGPLGGDNSDWGFQTQLPHQVIASDGYEIGHLLTTEQLLFVLANRDRMERDFFIGRSYRDLAEALEKRAEP